MNNKNTYRQNFHLLFVIWPPDFLLLPIRLWSPCEQCSTAVVLGSAARHQLHPQCEERDTVALSGVLIVQPGNLICRMLLYIRLNFPGLHDCERVARKFTSSHHLFFPCVTLQCSASTPPPPPHHPQHTLSLIVHCALHTKLYRQLFPPFSKSFCYVRYRLRGQRPRLNFILFETLHTNMYIL